MNIRKTEKPDMPHIMEIYKNAKVFMRNNGNQTQWDTNYPDEKLIESDIEKGNSYVCVENRKIVGTFAFIIGEDPTYQVIENGQWHWNIPYGTIHRIASDNETKGVSRACFDFCSKKINCLRIDTHRDNKPMQAAVKRYGFKECGIIHIADGSERIAYDFLIL